MDKVKARFSSLDVRAIVVELLHTGIVGTHLQNVYDINPRTYIFKFTRKDTKIPLLVESGTRLHSTRYDRERPNVLPAPFTAKLRKHLRERRLTKLEQLGFDRIVHLEFGHDTKPEMNFHLFLEFFALGNIVLTDYSYKVISLLRQVKVKDKTSGEEIKHLAVGMQYDFQSFKELSLPDNFEQRVGEMKEISRNSLRSLLYTFSPAMIDFCLKDYKEPVDAKSVISKVNICIMRINNQSEPYKGGIIFKGSRQVDIFPILDYTQVSTEIGIKNSFNQAVDDYFYALEERLLEEQGKQQEKIIHKKFDAIRREQESRIATLELTIEDCLIKAQAIEANLKTVEGVLLVINTGLRNELSWQDLDELIQSEKRKGRPIAQYINKLRLNSSLVELSLPFEEQNLTVDIDIRLGEHGNANRYYEMRKAALEKLERTKAAFEQAMKSAETKVRNDTRAIKGPFHQHLILKRKALWFEKFNWFISSDSYLILSGKDAHQNEYLVRRLLKEGDAYVHADLSGASSVVVKNHRKNVDIGGDVIATVANSNSDSNIRPIPHRTLLEAGAFSLCFSKAWEAKIVTSAWWVHASQVSKTAPSGEYLGTGSFMIRGKKNFLPPSQLVLSFGFMFILDEDGTARRKANRLQKEARRDELGEEALDAEILAPREAKYVEILASSKGITEDRPDEIEQSLSKLTVMEPKSKVRTKKSNENVRPSPSIETKKKVTTRGKHGKMKKAKEKYKDQDEEERLLRMELLGNKPKKVVSLQSPQPRPKSTKSSENSTPKPNKMPITAIPIEEDDGAGEREEEEEEEEESGGMGELAIIDQLTGTPAPDETLIGAVAVAAPFTVLQHYKYRVKLLPGSLKRGTAVKNSVALILSENKAIASQQEKSLIKSIPDSDLNSVMPGKVRIVGSGVELSKVKKAMKKK